MFKTIVVGCAVASLTAAATVVASPASAAPTCAGLRATIVGTSGDDLIRGTARRDVIAAGGGIDLIWGNDGDDVICGGAGTDLVRGGRGSDTLRGGGGADSLTGGRGDDLLDAGPAGDADYAIFEGLGHGVKVDLAKGTARGEGRDRLVGVRHIQGTRYADVIVGTDDGNSIEGGRGRDRIWTRGGNDTVSLAAGMAYTGDGNDSVRIGGGGTVDTGPGGDLVDVWRGQPVVRTASGNDAVFLGDARPWIYGGSDRDELHLDGRSFGVLIDLENHEVGLPVWSVERIFGTRFDDVIRGTDADESFQGKDGDDRLAGRGGVDNLYGDKGNDRADGGGPEQDWCYAEIKVNC